MKSEHINQMRFRVVGDYMQPVAFSKGATYITECFLKSTEVKNLI